MGRAPCCSKEGLQKGPWSTKEDALLTAYIQANGEGHWRSLPKSAGLLRCGKSCRLRWMNYLRPGIKRGNITADEEDLIIRLQSLLGNRWCLIAGRLPGRTDNEIKNHWNTHLLKRLNKEGIQPKKSHKNEFKKSRKQYCKRKKPKKQSSITTNASSTYNRKGEEVTNTDTTTTTITAMTKVYVPKPIRVCGFTASDTSVQSVVSGHSSSSSISNQEVEVDNKQEASNPELSDISWSSFDQLDVQSYEGVHEYNIFNKDQLLLVDDCDLCIQGEVAVSENLLELVYDEYFQLL